MIERLLAAGDLPLHLSVSATTRRPRDSEVDGKHYYFWTQERFLDEMRAGAFLESAEVHGNCYGTLKREVEPYRERGAGVILDIDVQGAEKVRSQCPDSVLVFLHTSSLAAYEERLRRRGTEDEAAIQQRLRAAQRELARAGEYDYKVLNDSLEDAVARLRAIVLSLFERGNHAG